MSKNHIGKIMIGALVTTSTTVLVIDMFKRKMVKKAYPVYMERFKTKYAETKNVKNTIENIKEQYPKKSIEYKALDKASFYLDNSIMKDYKTAFSFIEKIYENEEVNKMHRECLKQEKDKIILMIEQKY